MNPNFANERDESCQQDRPSESALDTGNLRGKAPHWSSCSFMPGINGSAIAMLALIIAVFAQSALAQSRATANADSVSVTYGVITQHYLTTWSDPTLPAGLLRGMPPHSGNGMSPKKQTLAYSNSDSGTGDLGLSTSRQVTDHIAEQAILYAVDLGEKGMVMVISAKATLQPGACIALEQAQEHVNLRGINAGFCDQRNQATIQRLQSVAAAAAQRCLDARQQLGNDLNEGLVGLSPTEIGMFCDGS